MNIDNVFGQLRPILKLIGGALVIIAALKMFGVNINFGGGVTESALVGLGLLHV